MVISVRTIGRRGLRRTRRALGDSTIFLPLVLRLTPTGTTRRLSEHTVLVVEGFPRSANTFARHGVEVSSHVHTPSAVKAAVRRGLPCLVLIREPRPTLASLLVASPHVTAAAAIGEWCHHYEEIWPWRSGFVVATFDQVTTDLGAVIRALNDRFDTDLVPFSGSEGDVAAVFASIERRHDEVHAGAAHLDPRPSRGRDPARDAARDELARAMHRSVLAEADALYERYRRLSEATADRARDRGA
jgi:hypothetical protein